MSSPLSLRRNFSWTLAGNVVYAASQWGMLVAIARLGTPEMVGQFSLGLAVTAPIILFSNLALRQVQATDAKREYTFGEYFGLRIITVLLALVVIAAIAMTGYRTEAALVILLIGVAKAFEALSDVIYGLLQQHERMDRIAQSMMLKGPASLVALTIGLALSGSIIGGALGLVLVWGLLFLLYDIRSARLITGDARALMPQWNTRRLLQLGRLTLPLGAVMMLGSLNTNVPRIFVERYSGEAQLGIYAAMAYVIVAGTTIVSALGQAASPRLATYYAQDNRCAYGWLLIRLQAVGASLGVAGIVAAIVTGELILNLLYGPEYAVEAGIFVWIMLAAGITYLGSCLNYGVTAARVFKWQVILHGVPALAAISLSTWLIPTRGLDGAVIVHILVGLTSYIMTLSTIIWIIKKSPLSSNRGY